MEHRGCEHLDTRVVRGEEFRLKLARFYHPAIRGLMCARGAESDNTEADNNNKALKCTRAKGMGYSLCSFCCFCWIDGWTDNNEEEARELSFERAIERGFFG